MTELQTIKKNSILKYFILSKLALLFLIISVIIVNFIDTKLQISLPNITI
jgi:hypothetical protein